MFPSKKREKKTYNRDKCFYQLKIRQIEKKNGLQSNRNDTKKEKALTSPCTS
jgi:hypothetical protein